MRIAERRWLVPFSAKSGGGVQERQAGSFVGHDRNHGAEAHEIEDLADTWIGSSDYEAATEGVPVESI